jgi:hypothetical protein
LAIDLTGGIPADRENAFAERPADPEMRDSASFWVSDDRGEIGLPRFAIEALSAEWERHGYQLNLAFPDGRVYRDRANGDSHSPLDANGEPRILGAGPLSFRCVEPFKTWVATFDGEVDSTSIDSLIKAEKSSSRTDLRFSITATLAVPPWIQGSLDPAAKDRLENSVEGDLMGGPRYEQLFRCTGSVTVDGKTHEFNGSGLRIRRQGVRRISAFWGHCWQSALFPSGKAFGYIAYPPRADGEPTFNEGFIFEGDGELIPARVVSAPWLKTLEPAGEDVSLVLETDQGEVRIGGTTALPTIDAFDRPEMPQFPVLFQGNVRYTWDGEETYGMLERSTQRDKISWP